VLRRALRHQHNPADVLHGARFVDVQVESMSVQLNRPSDPLVPLQPKLPAEHHRQSSLQYLLNNKLLLVILILVGLAVGAVYIVAIVRVLK